MTTPRKQDSPKFKARVAVEAIRGGRTLNQLTSQFRIHSVQIAHWRRAAMEHREEIFLDLRKRKPRDAEGESNALHEEIGRLKVELGWLKRSGNSGFVVGEQRRVRGGRDNPGDRRP